MSGSMNRIKGVLLDLDNTLYNYDVCNSSAMNKVFSDLSRRYNIPNKDIKRHFYNARKQVKIILDGTAASHSRLLYFKTMIENLKGSTDPKLSLFYSDMYWKEYFKHMVLIKDAEKFLVFCKNKNIRIAVVTDLTAEIQLKKIIKLEILKYINFIITSEEVGKDKPDPKIFYYALNKLDCKPQDVIMIGDDAKRDILSAKKLGIRSYESFNDIPKNSI